MFPVSKFTKFAKHKYKQTCRTRPLNHALFSKGSKYLCVRSRYIVDLIYRNLKEIFSFYALCSVSYTSVYIANEMGYMKIKLNQ